MVDQDTDTTEAPAGPDPLASIAAEAAALEGGAAPPGLPAAPAGPPAAQLADEARAVAGVVLTVGLPLLAAWKPRYAACYGQREQAAIGDAFAQLAQSQGWQMGEAMGRYGPWLAFAAAVVGPVLPAVMEDMRKPEEPEAKPGQPVPPPAPAAPVAMDPSLAGERVL